MYDRDMPAIRAHALASPEGFADVVTFTLLTIRQHLVLIPAMFADVKELGDQSSYLLGAKRTGYRYVQAHKHVLHAAVKKAVEVDDPEGALDVLLNVPSLGLVKAGFVAQMCGLDVGCLDSHNVARYGLTENALRFRKSGTMRPATRAKKIRDYVALCQTFGGARQLWNSWCAYVADPEDRGARWKNGIFVSFRDPSDVSRAHLLGMGLEPVYAGEEMPF